MKRGVRSHRRCWREVAFIAAGILILGLTGAHAQTSQQGSATTGADLTEAQIQDLTLMASQYDISLEEAIARYAWHEPFSILVNDVREKFPNEFAGARIEGPTEGDSWIAFRNEAPETAIEMIRGFSSAVDLQEHRGFSERDIDQQLVDSHYAVWARKGLVKQLSSGYDLATGRITLEVVGLQARTASEKEELRERLAAVIDHLPSQAKAIGVEVRVVDGIDMGDDTVYGGVPVTGCTSGYSVTFGTGQRGISTAGHCDNNITYDGSLPLNFVAGHQGTWGDVQYHTSGEYEDNDFYYNDGVRREVTGRGFRTEGQQLCKYGKSTSATCDEVYQLNHCNGDRCHLTAMHNRKASGGDSGGPWYYGNTAYGIHQGYKWWNFKNRDLFTPVTYFDEALNIQVATS